MPLVVELYRTVIQHKFVADTFFPEIKTSEFEMDWEMCHKADLKNAFDYCFQKWSRKQG